MCAHMLPCSSAQGPNAPWQLSLINLITYYMHRASQMTMICKRGSTKSWSSSEMFLVSLPSLSCMLNNLVVGNMTESSVLESFFTDDATDGQFNLHLPPSLFSVIPVSHAPLCSQFCSESQSYQKRRGSTHISRVMCPPQAVSLFWVQSLR
jgi:hypothetical protein